MLALAIALINLFTLVFKSWLDWDAERKKENEEKRAGWQDAAKSGDVSVINAHIDRMRQ